MTPPKTFTYTYERVCPCKGCSIEVTYGPSPHAPGITRFVAINKDTGTHAATEVSDQLFMAHDPALVIREEISRVIQKVCSGKLPQSASPSQLINELVNPAHMPHVMTWAVYSKDPGITEVMLRLPTEYTDKLANPLKTIVMSDENGLPVVKPVPEYRALMAPKKATRWKFGLKQRVQSKISKKREEQIDMMRQIDIMRLATAAGGALDELAETVGIMRRLSGESDMDFRERIRSNIYPGRLK